MTLTLGDIETIADRACYDWLDRTLVTPIIDTVQAQGDVLVVPVTRTAGAGAVDVPRSGVDVVRAVDGSHAHTLLAPDGGCRIVLRDSGSADDLVIALIDSTETCYLLHAEHGATGLAPGRYEVRRQREFDAAEARRIAD